MYFLNNPLRGHCEAHRYTTHLLLTHFQGYINTAHLSMNSQIVSNAVFTSQTKKMWCKTTTFTPTHTFQCRFHTHNTQRHHLTPYQKVTNTTRIIYSCGQPKYLQPSWSYAPETTYRSPSLCSHVACIFLPTLPHGGHPLGNARDSSYGRVPHRGSHELFTSKTYVSVFLVIFFALEFCMYD
jgi:hypothetical protein